MNRRGRGRRERKRGREKVGEEGRQREVKKNLGRWQRESKKQQELRNITRKV